MKQYTVFLQHLIWLTQLGLSVVCPLALFVLLGVLLNNRFALGSWCVWVGVILGIVGAAGGLVQSLRSINRLKDDGEKPPRGFNDHD